MRQSTRKSKSPARSTGRTRRNVVAILTGAMLSVVALAPAAHAVDATTSATFTLNGGSLAITAASTAALNNAATGAPSLTGSLGAVTVTDLRGNLLGWTTSATSTSFTGTGLSVIPNSSVVYAPGTATQTGNVVVTAGTGGSMATSQIAALATAAIGNNTGSWTPGLTIALPADAIAGNYTGTITHSVI